jgi:fumarylacetoacetase
MKVEKIHHVAYRCKDAKDRFRRGLHEPWAIGVAIGDKVLDLRKAGIIATSNMNELMSLNRLAHRKLRRLLSTGLTEGSHMQQAWSSALAHRSSVEMGLPCEIGGYTDFYVGIHHATAVGRLFRPENPLLPNYKWAPIGYHGRASAIAPSGQGFLRPSGQIKEPGDDAPALGQTRRLDFELELGIFVGVPNAQGCPIPPARPRSTSSAWPSSMTGVPGISRPGNISRSDPFYRRISPALSPPGS